MTKQETKLDDIERKYNARSKIKNWINTELKDGVYTVPDGRKLTPDQYQEFCNGLSPDTGVLQITRVAAQLPKED